MVIDREIGKRLCVSGGDPEIVESPSEPQWSPKGTNFFFYDLYFAVSSTCILYLSKTFLDAPLSLMYLKANIVHFHSD